MGAGGQGGACPNSMDRAMGRYRMLLRRRQPVVACRRQSFVSLSHIAAGGQTGCRVRILFPILLERRYVFSMKSQSLSALSLAEHIALFTKAPKKVYLGHMSSACVLLYLAHESGRIPAMVLMLWGLFELLITPYCLGWLTRNYRDHPERWGDGQRWMFWTSLLFLSVGMSWGAMLFFSLNPDNPAHFSMQMAIAAGATSAAARSLGLFPIAFFLYGVPFLGLLAGRLFMLGGDYGLLAVLVLVFLVMLLGLAKDVLASMQDYIRVKYQNLELARESQEAAERADHANREKTRLLAAASHDLRQPVHALGLYLETLSPEALSSRDQATVERMKQSLDMLTRLFNSVLDVSLLDAGRVSVSRRAVALHRLVMGVADDFQMIAENVGVSIVVHVPDIWVETDPVLLRRMVQNLVSNALRHSQGGVIDIRVATEPGERIALSVADDGAGIPQHQQSLIFEEFSQLDVPRRATSGSDAPAAAHALSHDKGLGLGLAIVKRLAGLLELEVRLASDTGGTVFTLAGLETIEAPAETARPRAAARTIAFSDKRVFIMDDDQENLNAMTELLNHWGCTVEGATGGDALFKKAKPDLLLVDYELAPDMTGLDWLTRAAMSWPDMPPALVLSGNTDPFVRARVEAAGYLFIAKPVQAVQLRSALLQAFTAPVIAPV